MIKISKRKYFYDKLFKMDLSAWDEVLRVEFEEYFNIPKVIDAVGINLDGEDGFVILEENIDYQILFMDKIDGDATIIFRHLSLEEAFKKYNDIKCQYKNECL